MRVLLVLLGAATFPARPDLSSPVFAKSFAAVRDWMLDKAHGPMVVAEDCLCLFDSHQSWPDQEVRLANWLAERIAMQPETTDLIVHYVGHGGFHDESRDYYLMIRATRADNAFYSSIIVESLWRTLRSGARRLRRFLIIDACFAGAAARALMAPLEEAVKVKVRDLQEKERALAAREAVAMPASGTVMLCSSSARDPSSMLGVGDVTQFTDGLMQVLSTGSSVIEQRLSFAQVHMLVRAALWERYGEAAVAPELHALDQRFGLPQDVPIFPNLAPHTQEMPEQRRKRILAGWMLQATADQYTIYKMATEALEGRGHGDLALIISNLLDVPNITSNLFESLFNGISLPQVQIAVASPKVKTAATSPKVRTVAAPSKAKTSATTSPKVQTAAASPMVKSLKAAPEWPREPQPAVSTSHREPRPSQSAEELFNKGRALITKGRDEEASTALIGSRKGYSPSQHYWAAITVYNDLLNRFENESAPSIRVIVAKALYGKGIAFGALGRYDEEIAVYDDLLALFGTATEVLIREQVVMALRKKGIRLGTLNRTNEAIMVYDHLLARFSTAAEALIREQVTRAESSRRRLLKQNLQFQSNAEGGGNRPLS